MRIINEFIIHCSATNPNWMHANKTSAKVEEIRRWHKAKTPPWRDIGYHYLIDRDGTVARGRPVEQVGAHVKGHNSNSVGICLIGGHGGAATDSFNEHFTPEQAQGLDRLLKSLKTRFGPVKVSGHNQYANKACPCFSVPDYFVRKVAIDEPIAPPTEKPKTSFWAALSQAFANLFGGKK